MGQQQLLLIILGVIIVGVAIAVGISQFGSNAASSAHDAILTDLTNLGANAFQYRIKPTAMGGGGGSYTGYSVPKGLDTNATGFYTIPSNTGSTISFTGSSVAYPGNSITSKYDSTGKLSGTIDISAWNPQ